MTEPVKVFVSYSWGTEKETRIVDQLEPLCRKRGIDLIRDNKTLTHGDSIKKFMDALSKGDHVITVFSKPYFESKWCMYELLRIYQRGDFDERTHPIITDDCNLHDRKYRLSVVEYWKLQYKEIQSDLAEFDEDDVESERAESVLCRDIYQNINKILNFARDRVTTPLTDLQENGFAQLLDLINLPSPIRSTSQLPVDEIIKTPDQIAAWINRTQQWENHIEDRIDQRDNNRPLAFVVAGVDDEWPSSLLLRLSAKLGIKKSTTITPKFNGKFANRKVCGCWYSLLHELLGKEELDQLDAMEPDDLENKLIDEFKRARIFRES